MKYKYIYSILIMIIQSYIVHSQCTLSGNIYDNSEPLSAASAILYTKYENSYSFLNYDIAANDGSFSIPIDICSGEHMLVTTYLGYTSDTTYINLSSDTSITILLINNPSILKEITIVESSIVDTNYIAIDTSIIKDGSSLREILQNSYGFEVSESGKISYKGKQINKILIDGKEMFVNQNQIGLEGIEYDMLSKISVINNYRDRYRVEFDNIVETVLNLDVNSNFRGIIKSKISAAGGIKSKYSASYTGAYFSDKINVFSLNNTNNINKRIESVEYIQNNLDLGSNILSSNLVNPSFSNDDNVYNTSHSDVNLNIKKEFKSIRSSVHLKGIGNKNKFLFSREQSFIGSGELFEKATLSNKYVGDVWIFDINNDIIINSNSTISQDFSVGFLNSSNSNTLNSVSNIYNQTLKDKYAYGDLLYSTKFGSNQIFNVNYNYTNHDINSDQNNNTIGSLIGANKYTKHGISALYRYKYNNFVLPYVQYRYRNIDQDLNTSISTNSNIYRSLNENSFRGGLQGQSKKIEYNTFIEYAHIGNSHNSETIDIFNYRLNASFSPNASNNFAVTFKRENELTDIYASADTSFYDYNNIFLSAIPSNFDNSTALSAKLEYNYSNVLDQKSILIDASFIERSNYIRYNATSINNLGLIEYRLDFADRYKEYRLRTGYKKGFYSNDYNNNWMFTNRFTFSYRTFPLLNSQDFEQIYLDYNLGWNSNIRLILDNGLFNIIALDFKYTTYQLRTLSETEIMTNSTSINMNLSDKRNNWRYDFNFGINVSNLGENYFNDYIFSLNSTYTFKNKTELKLEGSNLINLLNQNSQRISVFNIGDIQNKIINNNFLSYIIFGITFKL